MKDEHGMPGFHPEEKFPWCFHGGDEGYHVYDADGGDVCHITDTEREVVENMVHASNWIIPCREIVRRLAEYYESYGLPLILGDDAAKLWADMQRDAKGGGGVH